MRAVAASLGVLALAGCGSHASSVHGREVFGRACSHCHTLTGHDTAVPGGDLALGHLSASDVAGFVRVMPVRLSAADVHAVSAYVVSRERRR